MRASNGGDADQQHWRKEACGLVWSGHHRVGVYSGWERAGCVSHVPYRAVRTYVLYSTYLAR